MQKLGVEIVSSSSKSAKVIRTTKETVINVEVDFDKKDMKISSGLDFLDHMIESLAWWACISLGVNVQTVRRLTHTISEDAGITFGQALRAIMEKRMNEYGVNGFGSGSAALDEALSTSTIVVEGRRNAFVRFLCEGAKVKVVEDMRSTDLVAFIEGLSQGLGATLHLDLIHGNDPHHVWETAFRAVGLAISGAFEHSEWRKGATIGVKGIL
jgi:imidazoleglycerol phosphate dehydratase HisB